MKSCSCAPEDCECPKDATTCPPQGKVTKLIIHISFAVHDTNYNCTYLIFQINPAVNLLASVKNASVQKEHALVAKPSSVSTTHHH